MRSVSELLKTYNVVNTPEGRKYSVRFFAGLVALALVGVGVFFMAGGPATEEEARFAEQEEEEEPIAPDDREDLLPDGNVTIPQDLLDDPVRSARLAVSPH